MLRKLGADALGMSTVPEAIVARHSGMQVLGISCITNVAAGMSGSPINHEEVIEVGARAGRQLAQLIVGILPRLPAGSALGD
jgi:purine-nucleoside phosphorylase